MLNKLKTIAFLLILQIFSVQAEEIYAVPEGGNWENPATWVENSVPTEEDDVVINGRVYLNSDVTISGLIVNEDSILESQNTGQAKTLIVNYGIENYGTIQNYNGNSGISEADRLNIEVSYITNYGLWRNYQLTLEESAVEGDTIDSYYVKLSGEIYLEFEGFSGNVEFNNASLFGDDGNTITFSNATGTGTFNGFNLVNFTGSVSASLYGKIPEIQFVGENQDISGTFNATKISLAGNGTKNILDNTTINGLLNIESGVILESTANDKILTINGNVLNQGTIQESGVIKLLGNLINNGGTWQNTHTHIFWPEVIEADYYELKLNNNLITITNSFYNISDFLLASQNFDWQVRTISGEDYSNWSELNKIANYSEAENIRVSPSEYDFGSVNLWQNSPPQTFTITNTSNFELYIYSFDMMAGWSSFEIHSNNCNDGIIAPIESCTVEVVFSAYFPWEESDTLVISYVLLEEEEDEESEEVEEGEVYIDLTGEGVLAPPELIAPSGIINTNKPTFSWHQMDAGKYRISVTDATNNTTEWEFYGEDCSYQTGICESSPDITIAQGDAHWKALSIDMEFGEESPWSESLDFHVEVPSSLQFSQATPTSIVNENEASITLTVTRTGGSIGAISVNYTTFGRGTAIIDQDYVPVSGTLNWDDGETDAKTFTVNLIDDGAVEADETFTVTLHNPTNNAILGSPETSVITIISDDIAALIINEIDYTQLGETAEFIELKNISANPINLGNYTVQLIDGETNTAYKIIDLPEITLAAGDFYVICSNNSCDLSVTPINDFIQNGALDSIVLLENGWVKDAIKYEDEESSGGGLEDYEFWSYLGLSRFPDGSNSQQNNVDFSLRCLTPGAANIEANSHCYELSIDNVTINEAETIAQFIISLNQANVIPVTVVVATTNHTARAGSDYVALEPSTLIFALG